MPLIEEQERMERNFRVVLMPNNAEKVQNRDSNAFPVARTQTMM